MDRLPQAQAFNNPRGQAINRLIHLGDAPPPVANAPVNDPDRFIRRAFPSSHKDNTAYPHWKKAFEDLANDGPAFAVLLDDLDHWLTTVQSHSSPSSQKKRDAMEFKWWKFVTTLEPGINEERVWHSDVILKHSDKFLYVLVSFFYLSLSFLFKSCLEPYLSGYERARKHQGDHASRVYDALYVVHRPKLERSQHTVNKWDIPTLQKRRPQNAQRSVVP